MRVRYYIPHKICIWFCCVVFFVFVLFWLYYSCWMYVFNLPLFPALISLALGQLHGRPHTSEVSLKNRSETDLCLTPTKHNTAGIILNIHPANEKWRYNVMSSPIGCAHTHTSNFLHNTWDVLLCFLAKVVASKNHVQNNDNSLIFMNENSCSLMKLFVIFNAWWKITLITYTVKPLI